MAAVISFMNVQGIVKLVGPYRYIDTFGPSEVDGDQSINSQIK